MYKCIGRFPVLHMFDLKSAKKLTRYVHGIGIFEETWFDQKTSYRYSNSRIIYFVVIGKTPTL